MGCWFVQAPVAERRAAAVVEQERLVAVELVVGLELTALDAGDAASGVRSMRHMFPFTSPM